MLLGSSAPSRKPSRPTPHLHGSTGSSSTTPRLQAMLVAERQAQFLSGADGTPGTSSGSHAYFHRQVEDNSEEVTEESILMEALGTAHRTKNQNRRRRGGNSKRNLLSPSTTAGQWPRPPPLPVATNTETSTGTSTGTDRSSLSFQSNATRSPRIVFRSPAVGGMPSRQGTGTVSPPEVHRKRRGHTAGAGEEEEEETQRMCPLVDERNALLDDKETNKNRKKESSLWRVPPEILLEVFDYLDLRSVTLSIPPVCQRWAVLSSSSILWRHIALRLRVTFDCHTDAKDAVKMAVVRDKLRIQQEVAVVEGAYERTTRRIEERMRDVPQYTQPLLEEERELRLPARVNQVEANIGELTVQVNSFSSLQSSLSRSLRENKASIQHWDDQLQLLTAQLKAKEDRSSVRRKLVRFEQHVLRALLSDLQEIPLVLRRGISSFFEADLLAYQSAGDSRFVKRWGGFKQQFPGLQDGSWASLLDRSNTSWTSSNGTGSSGQRMVWFDAEPSRSTDGSSYTPAEMALLTAVNELNSLSRAELLVRCEADH